jgi:hypothetical protein
MMKTRTIWKRIGFICLLCLLLACVGCNQPKEELPTSPNTEQPTEAPTETPTEQPTEDVTDAPAEGVAIFYADVDSDDIYERIEVCYLLANTTEELTAPTLTVYKEIDGKDTVLWSINYNLNTTYTGISLVGNSLRLWAVKDEADYLAVSVFQVAFDGTGNLVRKCGQRLEKLNGVYVGPVGHVVLAMDSLQQYAGGGAILLSNWGGVLTYSTPENKLTELPTPEWVKEFIGN